MIDSNKLNSLLNIRHNVIHKDAAPGLTEATIVDYKDFLISFIEQIDNYLFNPYWPWTVWPNMLQSIYEMSFASKPLQIKKSFFFHFLRYAGAFFKKYVVTAINTLNTARMPFWTYFFRSSRQDGQKNKRKTGRTEPAAQ